MHTTVTSDTIAPGAFPVPVLSPELTRVSSGLSFIEGVHIGARLLHVLNLIWFGCIAHLSQLGGGANSYSSNYFYLDSLA